ncbi:hypothetical protein [Burkholderia cenocepacia]|uniref:hypothetical protein n=1 Tax=Burkholderia cenocepacia TaxID=95486 RepID=UPI0019079935|nr:hypothetical protein [Burkholderia cenocepacia]MBJ9694098.1 hypothetical protein [Burkholderia cenocepacia]
MFQKTPLVPGSVVGRLLNHDAYSVPNVDVEMALIELFTNAVVASCVVFVPVEAVGADGVPLNVGLAMVGEVDRTTDPVPVALVTPVPPLDGARGV